METSYIFNENEYLNIDNSVELDKSYIESFILSNHLTEEEENQYSVFYDCPCCGGYLVSKIDGELCGGHKYKYCYHCGQALDWSDTE